MAAKTSAEPGVDLEKKGAAIDILVVDAAEAFKADKGKDRREYAQIGRVIHFLDMDRRILPFDIYIRFETIFDIDRVNDSAHGKQNVRGVFVLAGNQVLAIIFPA
jgi:hypothetical protein